jgi:hypothetical protein
MIMSEYEERFRPPGAVTPSNLRRDPGTKPGAAAPTHLGCSSRGRSADGHIYGRIAPCRSWLDKQPESDNNRPGDKDRRRPFQTNSDFFSKRSRIAVLSRSSLTHAIRSLSNNGKADS